MESALGGIESGVTILCLSSFDERQHGDIGSPTAPNCGGIVTVSLGGFHFARLPAREAPPR